MNTIEQAREVSRNLRTRLYPLEDEVESMAVVIDALIAELEEAQHTINIQAALTKGHGKLIDKLRAELAALKNQEPVGYAYAHQDYIGSVIVAKGQWAPSEIPLFLAAGAQPPGYQLVPVEPTEAMCAAGQDHPGCIGVWEAMLAAAPTHPLADTGKPIERKPLTADEIQFVAQTVDKDWHADDVDDEWHVRFARAIEQAHGIKEQS